MKFKQLLFQTFTGKDNHTIDIARIIWMFGCLVFLGCAVYATALKESGWDAIAFGTGFGMILAAGGAAVYLKKDTEPEP